MNYKKPGNYRVTFAILIPSGGSLHRYGIYHGFLKIHKKRNPILEPIRLQKEILQPKGEPFDFLGMAKKYENEKFPAFVWEMIMSDSEEKTGV